MALRRECVASSHNTNRVLASYFADVNVRTAAAAAPMLITNTTAAAAAVPATPTAVNLGAAAATKAAACVAGTIFHPAEEVGCANAADVFVCFAVPPTVPPGACTPSSAVVARAVSSFAVNTTVASVGCSSGPAGRLLARKAPILGSVAMP